MFRYSIEQVTEGKLDRGKYYGRIDITTDTDQAMASTDYCDSFDGAKRAVGDLMFAMIQELATLIKDDGQ